MRVLIQRVSKSSVEISERIFSETGKGLLLLIGIGPEDTEDTCRCMIRKILDMRIFEDNSGKMNLSVLDIEGEVMLVSQFTLYASNRKGNRPSFTGSASAEMARKLFERFTDIASEIIPGKVKSGVFAADMKVGLVNDGPVTIWLDSSELPGNCS